MTCPAPGCDVETDAETCLPHWLEVPHDLRHQVQMVRGQPEWPLNERRKRLVVVMKSRGLW